MKLHALACTRPPPTTWHAAALARVALLKGALAGVDAASVDAHRPLQAQPSQPELRSRRRAEQLVAGSRAQRDVVADGGTPDRRRRSWSGATPTIERRHDARVQLKVCTRSSSRWVDLDLDEQAADSFA